MAESEEEQRPPGTARRVVFHYIKSKSFRVIHADGAIGGITPRMSLHIALFSERPAIPQKIVNAINPDGSLGEEIVEERVTREGFVREVEVEVLMNLEAAKAFLGWLQGHVSTLENRLAAMHGKAEETK